MLLMVSMLRKVLDNFMKKNYKRQINKDFGWKKSLKGNEINYMSNGNDMIIYLMAVSIKRIFYKKDSITS